MKKKSKDKQINPFPKQILEKVKVKMNKREIQKIKKPLFQTRKVKSYSPKLGIITLEKINGIKSIK